MKLMISYSWSYKKPLVDRLYRYLVDNGHDVWKDDEGGIKSNLVDDMAEAVNNADFVIVCFSTPYAQESVQKTELTRSWISDKIDILMNNQQKVKELQKRT